MAEDFGLKIALQGEREFKKAITEINASFRVLGSEMKLVDAQFKRSDDAQAKYAAKGKVLAEQIAAQRDKINTLEAALKNAATNFGETDRRTLAWQTQLNNAKAALADLEGELEDNNKALSSFGDATDDAGDDARDAAKDTGRLEDAVDDLGDEMDTSGKKALSFGDVLKANLASEAIVAGVKAIGSAIKAVGCGFVDAMKDGVQYNATMESYTASFTTMLGDEAKAHKLVADLKAKAASTPYGMQDLADATRTLMSFGISAQDAQKYMGMLGDVAQGDKEKFSSLSLAFAQVSSAGKLTGQDLMQMINAGFNPLEEISRKTGKSIGELKEEMSKGAISAEMVAEAFESATAEGGRFYGAMENQSKTFNGQLSTLQDGVANLKGQLAGGLTEMLSGSLMPMVNGWVSALSEAFEKDGVDGLITALGQVIQEALAFISEQLPAFLDAALRIVTSLADGLIQALPAITEAATGLLIALVQGILQLLPELTTAAATMVATLASGIGEALPELIPAAIAAIVGIVQALIDNLPLLLDAALQLVTGLAQGIIEAIPVLIEALPALITSLLEFLVGAIPQLIEAGITLLTSLVEALPTIIETIVAALPEIIDAIINAVLGSLPLLIDAGVKLFVALVEALPTIITTIISAIPRIISSVLNAISSHIPQLMMMGVTLLTSLIRNLPTIISTIVSAIPQIVSGIVSAFGQGVSQMVSVGGNLVRGLWNGIQGLAGWLWNQVSSWASSIWDGITSFFGIHSPSRKMAWAGEMLARGLAAGIDDNAQRATQAADAMAADIDAAFANLTEGLDVPVDVKTQAQFVHLDQVSNALTTLGTPTTSPSGLSAENIQSVVEAVVPSMIKGMDIRVVLDDGTLVGKLAPRIDTSLAGLARRNPSLSI
ncbi:phage tail protein [Dermabacteraceae bacterium P13138]